MLDPRIEKHLISDQGEIVIDEVRKHWAAIVAAILELLGGFLLFMVTLVTPELIWWLPFFLGLAVMGHALWRILASRMDRFVITNMRVFRVHGILSQRIATMPLSRILDISVYKPFIGRIFGFGHFIFESAAQEQGLRDIRYVGAPDARGLTIQRVIQQAGLRGAQFRGEAPLPSPQQSPQFRESPAAVSVPPPPVPQVAASVVAGEAEWLANARHREELRIAELRAAELRRTEQLAPPTAPDPDSTPTSPLPFPR